MADHVSGKRLQRAELARRTGCNLETIRYYEKTGMIPDPPRTVSGYRVYDEAHVARLRFILRARELGFSIDEIRGLLSDARREIDARTPNPERALEFIEEAQALYEQELAWRSRAAEELLPELDRYDMAIRDTIGLRKQPKLPREQALFIASCNAEHRDISLNF